MKVVLPAILALEAVVVALAIPVAVVQGGRGAGAGWLLGGLALLLVLGAGAVRGRHGVAIGWALQVAVILTGFVVPAMAVLGALFLGVWVVGVIYGAKGDAAAARNAAAEAQWRREQAAGAQDDPPSSAPQPPDAPA